VPLRLDDLRVELPGVILNNGSVSFTVGDPGSATKQLGCTIDADDDPLVCRESDPALEKLFRGDSIEFVVQVTGTITPATGIAWSFRTATP
jgi:hypothetical protein